MAKFPWVSGSISYFSENFNLKTPHSFTIYNASAGSGKTFTLVKEYLLLLFTSEKVDNYRNILAVTFTNKAVAEMKDRIVENLHAFSQEQCPVKFMPLMDILCKETGLPPEEIKEKARAILKNIIHNYASFEVSTIDGFTHRVLRTFAKDLDLPLNFEVQLDTGAVMREAVERVINKAGEDKQLTRVLVNFAISKADEDKSWDISRDLLRIAELLTVETNQPFLKMLRSHDLNDFEELARDLKKQSALLREEIQTTAEAFFQLLETNALEPGDFSGKHCPNFFEKLRSGNFVVGFDAGWQKNLAEVPLYPKRVDQQKRELLDLLQPDFVALFEKAKGNLTTLEFFEAIMKNLPPLSLLSAIQHEIEEIKRDRSLVLISEFNAKIGSAVKDQPAPFIYERLGERYSHYFIDEFQDTSQLQWENLVPLIDHALSREDRGSLTLVGDAKQSIYRWRGGKAEQFMELCQENNPFNLEQKKVVVLPNNYRSAREVVDFNNDFFTYSSQCFSSLEHQELFKASAQEPVKKEGGYVNISFVEAETVDEETRLYSEKVLRIIRDLEERKVPKNNICILTRTGKQGVAIANFLSENNIPIISFQSLLVGRSPEVRFLISMLHFAVEGKDRSLKLEILEFLLDRQFSGQNRYDFISERLGLDGEEFLRSISGGAGDLRLQEITDQSLYEAVEYIIRAFGLVEGSNAYVQFFLDFVFEASQKDHAGIFQFLELWEEKKESLSIVSPKSENAVQIMTIHKAKGLEFPIVIYPFANSSIEDIARESLWMALPEHLNSAVSVGYLTASKKMKHWSNEASRLYQDLCGFSQLDSLNVLYVALTRAVQQLYVISKMDVDRKGNETSNKISGLFISYLKSKGRWDGSVEYEFGNRDTFEPEPQKSEASFKQEKFHSSATEGKGISIVTRSGMLWDSRQEKAIGKGHLIHEILSGIGSAAEVETALSRARSNGLFKNQEEEEIIQGIHKVIDHPGLRSYFAEDAVVFNERDIITGTGAVIRPDRLNIAGQLVHIIDYKTGEVHDHHRDQVNGYAQVLQEMGYGIGEKILVYINEEVTVNRI